MAEILKLDRELISGFAPQRPEDGHKNSFGTSLICAGSEYMTGAAVMASGSALRSGAGLVKVFSDEKTLDAIGCVSGTGPAYVMLFIEAMADAAVSLGIKRDDALKIAAGTVMGSGKLCLDTGTNPAILKDMVCSPGGTTIAGVMALEENGFRNAVIKSVTAAYDKTLLMQGRK